MNRRSSGCRAAATGSEVSPRSVRNGNDLFVAVPLGSAVRPVGYAILSRSMAAYYAQFGIRVNCVCPGLLDTPMSQRAIGDPTIREALTLLQPLYPHVGGGGDVADAILFLAGDRAKFITGIALPVDGGWSAQ